MTHSYTVSGITCEGCVAKVRHQLLTHPEVTAADVTLAGQKAVVTMRSQISVEELQDSIGRGTKYTITADAVAEAPAGQRSWLETYKPILLIFAFISAVAAAAARESAVPLMSFMNIFMGGFFLVFSFFKLLDLKGFAESYAMYDVIARRWSSYGYVYAFIELVLGFAYILRFDPLATNAVTFVVMSVSLTGVPQSVLSNKTIKCACLGSVFNLPMSAVTIIEDSLMIVMSAVMIIAALMRS